MNSSEEERAMPLEAFIAGAIEQLGTEANEILVGPVVGMRANPGPDEHRLGQSVQRHDGCRLSTKLSARG
jgi:hypothetical protein